MTGIGESASSASDLPMINRAVPCGGNRTRNTEAITDTIGPPPAQLRIAPPDPAAPQTSAINVELTDDVLHAVGDALGQVTVTTPTLALLAEPGVKHR